MSATHQHEKGLTLIEVLLALLVVSIAGLALARVSTESLRSASHIENHALAMLVADNRMVEDILAKEIPGMESGETMLGGREWRWERKTGTDLNGALMRMEVEVTGPDETKQVFVSRTGWRPLNP